MLRPVRRVGMVFHIYKILNKKNMPTLLFGLKPNYEPSEFWAKAQLQTYSRFHLINLEPYPHNILDKYSYIP